MIPTEHCRRHFLLHPLTPRISNSPIFDSLFFFRLHLALKTETHLIFCETYINKSFFKNQFSLTTVNFDCSHQQIIYKNNKNRKFNHLEKNKQQNNHFSMCEKKNSTLPSTLYIYFPDINDFFEFTMCFHYQNFCARKKLYILHNFKISNLLFQISSEIGRRSDKATKNDLFYGLAGIWVESTPFTVKTG